MGIWQIHLTLQVGVPCNLGGSLQPRLHGTVPPIGCQSGSVSLSGQGRLDDGRRSLIPVWRKSASHSVLHEV